MHRFVALTVFLVVAGRVAFAQSEAPPDPTPDAGVAPAPAPDLSTVVTGQRGLGIGESASATSLLSPKEARLVPARHADDALRNFASVALPRAGSGLQHPTAQSVSLRGVGGGRTLVLLDGIPVNDAFGGWIQWNRIPLSALSRAEVIRGATANAWGNFAMGGVIQLFRAPTDLERLDLVGEYGRFDSYRVAGEGTHRFGDVVSVTALAHAYRTDGSFVVSAPLRGAVDIPEPFESQNAAVRVDVRPSRAVSVFGAASYYRQAAASGTLLSKNSMWLAEGTAGADWRPSATALWQARVFVSGQRFHNINTRIGSGRASETLAVQQDIPAIRVGASVLGSKQWRERHSLTVGADVQSVSGTNSDVIFNNAGARLGTQEASGRQLMLGLFAEYGYTPVRALTLTAGLRADLWRNYAGETIDLAGARSGLTGRNDGAVNPRLSAVYRLSPAIALRGAGYTGFRAPTLNELYRSFIAAGVTSLPNSGLGAERLAGGELGVDVSPVQSLRFGVTGFYNALYGLVQFVTLDPTSRRRENVGEARATGAEVDVRWRPIRPLTFTGSYAFTESRVVRSVANPGLVGNRLPTTPLHRAVIGALVEVPGILDASVRVRGESHAFSNDLNTFRQPSYVLVDATLSRKLIDGFSVYLSATNLLNATVVTDQTALVTNVGLPRTIWLGLRGSY